MKFLRKYSEEIFGAGIGLMVLGIVFFAWTQSQFASLKTYQQLATLIPLCLGGFLMSIDTFTGWDEASPTAKGKSVGLTVAFVLLVLGTIAWWLIAPDAR